MTMKNKVCYFFIVLGMMFVFSAILLLLLSAIVWKTDGSSGLLSGGVILVYILSNILGGFLMGRNMGQQKFFWGLLMGALYFGILLLVGVWLAGTKLMGNTQIISGIMVCAISGMLGGMLAPAKKQ